MIRLTLALRAMLRTLAHRARPTALAVMVLCASPWIPGVSPVTAAESDSPFSLGTRFGFPSSPDEAETIGISNGRCHRAFWVHGQGMLHVIFCELFSPYGFRDSITETRNMLLKLFPYFEAQDSDVRWGEPTRVVGSKSRINIFPFVDQSFDPPNECAGFGMSWGRRQGGLAKTLLGIFCSDNPARSVDDRLTAMFNALRLEGEFETLGRQ